MFPKPPHSHAAESKSHGKTYVTSTLLTAASSRAQSELRYIDYMHVSAVARRHEQPCMQAHTRHECTHAAADSKTQRPGMCRHFDEHQRKLVQYLQAHKKHDTCTCQQGSGAL
jgi:hypothetical protein